MRSDLEAAGIPASVPVQVAHELLQAGHHYLDVRCACVTTIFLNHI